MPTSSNGTWAWPILQLRNAYWKLSAVRYPFAYRSWAEPHFGDMSHCFGGDTTSGTRVYNSSVLRRLLNSPQQSAQLGSAWMLGLDLRLKSSGAPALTCLNSGGTILKEESYLLHTTLEPLLARRRIWGEMTMERERERVFRINGAGDHPAAGVLFSLAGAMTLRRQGSTRTLPCRRSASHLALWPKPSLLILLAWWSRTASGWP